MIETTAPVQSLVDEMVKCICGDEYPANSYGAGFIRGSGMCENCDAAQPAKDVAPVAVPGWKLVPLNATQEMWAAYRNADNGNILFHQAYRAMLAAAPTPTAPQSHIIRAAYEVLLGCVKRPEIAALIDAPGVENIAKQLNSLLPGPSDTAAPEQQGQWVRVTPELIQHAQELQDDWCADAQEGGIDGARPLPHWILDVLSSAGGTAAPEQAEQAAIQELLPDEIHQMAVEEGQPAEDGNGYAFTAEEFDLFIDRLLTKAAPPAQQLDDYPPCDYCGATVDYMPWHGSGMLNGIESRHIHACNDCRHMLPATHPAAPGDTAAPDLKLCGINVVVDEAMAPGEMKMVSGVDAVTALKELLERLGPAERLAYCLGWSGELRALLEARHD